MKRTLRSICLLLCLLFLPLASACAATPAPGESAPVIRVLLRRLALTDRADLTLDALYAARTGGGTSLAFPRGAQVVVQVRGGQIVLFYEGMSLSAGTSLVFTRQASDAPALQGLRFFDNSNVYPGDLRLTVVGGVLQPVLSISVEDYLLGVVPYEMSDSFPLEALKAQAVCARTYALSHVDVSREWDVVDTTNDQVFKGVNPGNVNTERAVRETAGFVAMSGRYLASCYYSASNGGQTELPQNHWGGSPVKFYTMMDDPYDAENPDSLVLRSKIDRRSPELPEAMLADIFAQLLPELTAQGFLPDETMFRIDSIDAIEPVEPRYEAPSRLHTSLALTIQWSGRRRAALTEPEEELSLFDTPSPSATPAPTAAEIVYTDFLPAKEPSVVKVDLFPTLIRALNLSISGADNELVTVVDRDDSFILEARRFGHGVGMSQRGAQWMAGHYHMTYDEILFFYYPGITLEANPAGALVLPTPAPELFNTPGPSATPTPRPTLMPVATDVLPEGAWLASVEGIEENSSLNLRAAPNQAADILLRLYKHQVLIVLEACEDPAWLRVRTDVIEGYVMSSFLLPGDADP